MIITQEDKITQNKSINSLGSGMMYIFICIGFEGVSE